MVKIKDFWNDESADSAIPLVIVLAVLSFGLLYIMFSITWEIPIQLMNDFIQDGSVTTQTAHYFELALNMWKCMPFFALIGLTFWCVERSKGGQIGIWTYFSYQTLMITGVLVSAYCVFAYGLSMDGITLTFDEVDFFTDVPEEWDTSRTRGIVISAMYYACLMPAYLTSILHMIHPIIIQKFNDRQVFQTSDPAADINFQQY